MLEWLFEHGISVNTTRLYRHRAILQFDASGEELEKLIPGHGKHIVERSGMGELRLRKFELDVPVELKGDVEGIYTRLVANSQSLVKREVGVGGRQKVRQSVGEKNLTDCAESWTPSCIRGEWDFVKHYKQKLTSGRSLRNPTGR